MTNDEANDFCPINTMYTYKENLHNIPISHQEAMELALRIELDSKAYLELKQLHDLINKVKCKVYDNRILKLYKMDILDDICSHLDSSKDLILEGLKAHKEDVESTYSGIMPYDCSHEDFPAYDKFGHSLNLKNGEEPKIETRKKKQLLLGSKK